MPADLSAPALSATTQGRFGTYTLDVYGPTPPPLAPPTFGLEDAPAVKCGERDRAFGGGLSAWSVDLTLSRGVSELVALIDSSPGSTLCRLSGPNGRGGTFTVWTRLVAGERERSAAPRVYGVGHLSLPTHDGVAALADAEPGFIDSIAQALAQLWQALPGAIADGPNTEDEPFAVWASWTLPAGTDPNVAAVSRLASRVVHPGLESALQAVRALAEVGGLAVYQPSDAPPDAPRWEAVPRSALGTAEPVARLYLDGTDLDAAPAVLPDREVPLPPITATTGGAFELPALGRVAITGTIERGLLAKVLGDGTSDDTDLGHLEPTAGLRVRADVRLEDAQSASGQVAVIFLRPDGGGAAVALDTALELSGDSYIYTTTSDLPSAGRVFVRRFGATTSGQDRVYLGGAVAAVDLSGSAIDRAEAEVAPPGPTAEITRPLLAENAAGNANTSWASRTTGAVYPSIESAAAATRASQQAIPLPLLDVVLRGLWGPEARFSLPAGPGDDGTTRSPFQNDVDLVVVGCEPDIRTGTTAATLAAVSVTPVSAAPSARTPPTAPAS